VRFSASSEILACGRPARFTKFSRALRGSAMRAALRFEVGRLADRPDDGRRVGIRMAGPSMTRGLRSALISSSACGA